MPKTSLIITVPVLSVDNVPYGPAVVSGLLGQHGIHSEIWDLNIDLYHQFRSQWHDIRDLLAIRGYANPAQSRFLKQVLRWVYPQLKKKLTPRPDVILLSVFSGQSLDFVVPLATYCRQICPDAYIVIGGRGLDNQERRTGWTYAKFYAQYLPVDCVYQGDAENKLTWVIDKKYQGHFLAPNVTEQDLSQVPPAKWHGLDFTRYEGYKNQKLYLPITGSKGCVRECTFCDVAGSWPKYVFRKGSDIAQEIISLYRDTGITKFEFTDNLINGSIRYFRDMNQTIADEIPDTLQYKGYMICRPQNEMTRQDFATARRAGAHFWKVGIESGSERVRHDMKKKFSNQDITWFAENCHDQGIQQLWLMFVGYPTETEEDFQDTLKLLRNHQHLNKDGMIQVLLSLPMMLTSNSSFMLKYQQEYGLHHNQEDPWSDFFWTSTIHKQNTFEVRLSRWRRFIEAMYAYGYGSGNIRQKEKLLEIDGIEKIYKENYANGKRIIPISAGAININKETHV